MPLLSRSSRPGRTRVALHAVTLAAAALTPAARAAAQDPVPPGVSVRLTYEAGTRPGVAVLPVRGAQGDSIRAVLQRDLDFGDRVTVLAGSAADAPAASAGRVSYDVAQKLGAAAVVQATVTPAGALHVALHDVARRQVLQVREFALGGAPPLSPEWRLRLHSAADELEAWITGVRGVAATRVLFVRDRRVWVVDSDGENARPLTDAGALSPAWHPTGTAFVHGTLTDRGAMQIVARTASGAGPRVLASAPVTNFTPDVSPDGRTVVFAHGEENGTDLFAVPFDGGGAPRRVTVGRGTENMSPSFAPDGRRLAFTSGRSGHPEVYITDADGTNADLLTAYEFGAQNYRSNPDWSPDGRLVAFQSLVGGQFQVLTIGLRDRGVKRLTTEGRNEDPAWAPDSRHLVVTSTRTGSSQLFVLDAETGRSRQLTRGAGGTRMAAWSPPLVRQP